MRLPMSRMTSPYSSFPPASCRRRGHASDGEVGDGDVLGLPGAMGDHRAVARAVGDLDGRQRLGERADLVDLDQDRVGDPAPDAAREALDVGDEEIVADELDARPEPPGERGPAVPVVLGEAALDAD